MENDRFIKENEFGKLVERKIDGEIKNVFIISDNAFQQAYDAHQRWHEKFKDKLYDKYNKPIDIDLLDKTFQKELLNNSDLECRRYEHKNFMFGVDFFSYEETILNTLAFLNLPFADLRYANFENAGLRNAHLECTDLRNACFECANLINAHLNGAVLKYACLIETILEGAILRDADLSSTNFKYANLVETNLEYAFLGNAYFNSADLSDATLYNKKLKEIDTETNRVINDKNVYKHPDINLQNTRLHNVDLSHVEGLTAEQIAGADLTNAKLPENLNNLTEITKPINEAIKSNGTLFSIIITIMAIIFLLSLSTDVKQANHIVKTVSVLGTEIDFTRNMLWIIPTGLYIVFLNFCMNLSNFWRLLSTMPAVFPDGRHLTEVIDHWIPTSFLYIFYDRLNDKFNIIEVSKTLIETIRILSKKDIKIPFKRRIKLHYILFREENHFSTTKWNIYIQAGFSFIILYLPIPCLITFFCRKFNLYLINNSWLTIAVIILTGFTLVFYIIDMVMTLKK